MTSRAAWRLSSPSLGILIGSGERLELIMERWGSFRGSPCVCRSAVSPFTFHLISTLHTLYLRIMDMDGLSPSSFFLAYEYISLAASDVLP